MLGWGRCKTAFANACGSFGDGPLRDGIELTWDFTDGTATFHVEGFLLASDPVDDAWRAGLICESRRRRLPRGLIRESR